MNRGRLPTGCGDPGRRPARAKGRQASLAGTGSKPKKKPGQRRAPADRRTPRTSTAGGAGAPPRTSPEPWVSAPEPSRGGERPAPPGRARTAFSQVPRRTPSSSRIPEPAAALSRERSSGSWEESGPDRPAPRTWLPGLLCAPGRARPRLCPRPACLRLPSSLKLGIGPGRAGTPAQRPAQAAVTADFKAKICPPRSSFHLLLPPPLPLRALERRARAARPLGAPPSRLPRLRARPPRRAGTAAAGPGRWGAGRRWALGLSPRQVCAPASRGKLEARRAGRPRVGGARWQAAGTL